MATLFNQTNLSPGTSFAAGGGGGGGGGSNFLNVSTGTITCSSITFLAQSPAITPPSIGTLFSGDMNIPITGNFVWFPYYNTPNDALMLNNNGLYFRTPDPSGTLFNVVYKAGGSNATLSNVGNATIQNIAYTSNTTASNVDYRPLNYTIRPDQATKGGQCYASFQFDAVDTGANYACVVGANNSYGFIGSIWPGYISMPFQIFGATVQIDSDNETFLFMDGNSGGLGTISTGTPFLSSSNAFSSIVSPAGDKANMSALLSTLKDVYPACFT